jgi:transcriptional regulator with XRE-family HTH domain
MVVIDRLIAAVKRSGLKRLHIATAAGMSAAKLSKILNQKQVPTVPEFIAIAGAIDLDPALLFTDGELVVDIDVLREALLALDRARNLLLAHVPPNQLPIADPIRPVPKLARRRDVVPVRAAANPNAELVVEHETERKLIPRGAWNRGAQIIARVTGDSMDGGPDPLRDGDLAYLKKTRSPRTANGHIVLIRRDDGLYLKRFEQSGHTIRLVSANDRYPAIELDARSESLEIFGYVVAHAAESSG